MGEGINSNSPSFESALFRGSSILWIRSSRVDVRRVSRAISDINYLARRSSYPKDANFYPNQSRDTRNSLMTLRVFRN